MGQGRFVRTLQPCMRFGPMTNPIATLNQHSNLPEYKSTTKLIIFTGITEHTSRDTRTEKVSGVKRRAGQEDQRNRREVRLAARRPQSWDLLSPVRRLTTEDVGQCGAHHGEPR